MEIGEKGRMGMGVGRKRGSRMEKGKGKYKEK